MDFNQLFKKRLKTLQLTNKTEFARTGVVVNFLSVDKVSNANLDYRLIIQNIQLCQRNATHHNIY